MKLTVLFLFAVVAITVASRQRSLDNDRSSSSSYLKNAQPFTSGHIYRFRYDSQIASGLSSIDSVTGTQQSTHRISAMVNFNFENDHTASLRLEDIRIGSLNGERSDLRRVQSMQLFDEHQIDSQKLEELQMPCSFKLNNGIVERVYFDGKDAVWSKNVKRAILNLIQLNIKERQDNLQNELETQDRESMSNMFSVKEITLEGNCEVTYSINKVSNVDEDRQVFNVTKAINFKKCSEIPTMYYGPRLVESFSMSERRQSEDQQQRNDHSTIRQSEEQQLDRSTVLRYQLIGTAEKYAIANVELLSQYVYKTLSDEQAQAMQTVVASRLTIDSIEKRTSESRVEHVSSKEESLLYSVEWDLLEKRFYQYGDEEYTRENSPFAYVQSKVTIIKSMIQKIVESTNDKTHGIETETTLKLQHAVELMRMCSMQEIDQIYREVVESKEHELNIFMDICAIAGTHNTIKFLIEKIVKEDITSTKAVVILRQLSSPFAVSEKQVDNVLRLCRHNVAEKSGPLRQACWLTAGSMIGELCKGSVRDNEMCSRHTEEKYQKILWTRYEEAENVYEKTIALKAIGNAANEFAIFKLEKLIADRRVPSILRIHAIDALRRLRNEMPRKIQRLLLPIFKNTLEVPEVRMTAFSMLMNTIPEKNILDQITYTLHSERSKHVKSFVLSLFKAYSASTVPEERELALHLRSALTMAKIDLDMACRYHRIPIYSGEQQEGLFLNLISLFSTTDSLPKHLSVSLDSLLNGLFEKDAISFSLTQNNVEELYHRFMENLYGKTDRRSSIRASRSAARNGEEELDSIFDDLKIKTREVFDKSPFGLINLRVRDVDVIVLPLGEEYMPTAIKAILNGQKLTSKNFPTSLLEGKPMRYTYAFSLNERSMKIATSSGMPLRLLHSLPIITSMSGDLKIQMSSENLKVNMKVQPLLSAVHTQKMEIWCPIVNTGVESLRSVELNLPLNMEARVMLNNDEDKVRIVLNVPQEKTRLVGFHSLPVTFTREYNEKSGLHGKTHVKTIRNVVMEPRLIELEPTETSVSVSGHYHKLTEMSLTALYNVLWTTENHIQVVYDRQSECADAIEFILSSKLFQTAEASSSKPRFEQFYQDKKNTFEPVFDDDIEDSDNLESNNERSKRLNTYLSSEYKPRAAYRHFVKTLIQTIGGKYNHKASARLEATCDSQMSFCKIITDIRRTPLLRGESNDWTLKAESQILMPEHVQEISQLNENDRRHNKLAVTVETQWGSEKMQKLNLKLQGERSVPQQWIKRSGVEWRRILATAFINKYDLVADYKLTPHFQAQIEHYFELLKFWNFWNVDSSEVMEERNTNEIRATLIIDPRTRQHMNISVKTPSERVRLSNVRLPMPIKPFTLIRPQEQRYEISSVEDMLTEFSDSRRAECRVDGRRIKTFDSVTYKAPIGNCYSVIAKDCARKSFVVLMKTIDENTEAKNIKIVTTKNTFEVELIRNRLVVKVNGERMNDDESRLREYNIDYSENLVRIVLPELGVSVRFDGKQAKVKLSKYYKDAQCGLCGTMNDDEHDEFRMNDNTLTDDVKTFHRSFSMINDDCDNIYDKQTLFGRESTLRTSEKDRENDFENEDMNEEVEEYEMFDRRTSQKDEDYDNVEEPIMKTKVMEYNHKICFSVKPIKECPRGSHTEKVDNIKIHFACLNRSSTEARRLLRQSRNNDITSKLSGYKPSFVETVRSARVCA